MDIKKNLTDEMIRSDCYRLLAACFYYPKKEVFIQENLFKNLTESFKKICPFAVKFSEDMEKAISHYSDEDLLVDYSKLFVGPSALIAPPYGSVYLDGARQVMGDSTMKVIGMYREAGLSISDDFKELPDHIAVELEFMSYLIFKEIEAFKMSDLDTALKFSEKQNLFLNKYLGKWVFLFCNKIKEGTDNKFYIALADCVSAFIMNSAISDDIHKHLTEKS